MDGGSAQCVPGGTRLAQLGAQLENAIANGVSPDMGHHAPRVGGTPVVNIRVHALHDGNALRYRASKFD